MTFFVEDGPHRFLLRSLDIGRKDIRVMGAKGNVIRKLKDHPGDMGMVDEDPDSIQTQPHELANYHEIGKGEGLRLLARMGSGGQRLVVLCPRVEDWLIQRAEKCGVRPEDYQLLGTAKRLHDVPRYEEKDGFSRFLAALNQDKGMCLLGQWILRG